MVLAGRRRRRPLQDKSSSNAITKIKNIHFIPPAHSLHPRPPTYICGRADNACTNLLGFFVRYVRTRGIAEAAEDSKSANFAFILCRTYSPRMARATNSCTRKVIFKRMENPLK